MILTLWRHGEAELSRSDEQRALSPLGREHSQMMAGSYEQWRSRTGIAPVAAVFFSPYRRTRETAELLADAIQPDRLEVLEALAPGARPESFTEEQFEASRHVILVSHQPFVSQAISYWADDATLAPLAPGGYSALEVLSLHRGGVSPLRHCPDPRAVICEDSV